MTTDSGMVEYLQISRKNALQAASKREQISKNIRNQDPLM